MAWAIPDELKAEFRTTANDRVAAALKALTPEGHAGDARVEMHTLAGESAMMGYAELATVARAAEAAAKTWQATPTPAAQLACAKLIRDVGRLLQALT